MSNNPKSQDEDFDFDIEEDAKSHSKPSHGPTTPYINDPALKVKQRLLEQRNNAQRSRHLPSRSLEALLKDSRSILPYATLRLPKTPTTPTAVHVMNIATRLELDDDLMQDHPISEMLRVEKLRDLPQSLTVKRSIKAQLTMSYNNKEKRKTISCWKRFKYSTSMTFSRIGMTLREVASTMELWYHSIKSIEGHFGSGIATYFKFLRWLFVLNITVFILSLSFVVIPQSLISIYEDVSFSGWDIITGSGFFTTTIMYYGFYSNETVSSDSTWGLHYNIPSAYFMTFLCCYVFTFILLSFKVARSYRKSFIETAGGLQNLYANKIFCGWDFGIASYKAANLRSATIYVELKELLGEEHTGTYRDCVAKTYAMTIQIAMTALVLTIMAGTGILLWFLLQKYKSFDNNAWSPLVVPLVVTIIMNLLPAFFSWLAQFEGYKSKRTALYVTMIRTYGMEVIVVGTLLAFWLIDSVTSCWQTAVAQEIYRLIIVDFIISIIIVFIAQMIRSKLHATKWKSLGAPRFDIARNTLNLIYNETLFWVAFYFSPLISLIIIIKMILTFHIKKYGVLNHCEPPSKSWRLAQTHTLFLALAFLSMVGVLGVLGYILTSVSTIDCGPFQGSNYTWEVILERMLKLREDSIFWVVVTFLAKPGIGAAVLIGMCVAVYYLRAQAGAKVEMVQILREMLVLEARDKEFLLSGISKVADQHWLYHFNPLSSPRASITSGTPQLFVLNSPPRGRRTSKLTPSTPRPSVSSLNNSKLPSHPFSNTVHPFELEESSGSKQHESRGAYRKDSNSSAGSTIDSIISLESKMKGHRYDFLY